MALLARTPLFRPRRPLSTHSAHAALPGLLAINTEQGLVHPYVLVTWGNQESVSGCQEQVFPDLWNSLDKVAGMYRDDEVRRVRQVARPYVPNPRFRREEDAASRGRASPNLG